jgi:hypothetical protein
VGLWLWVKRLWLVNLDRHVGLPRALNALHLGAYACGLGPLGLEPVGVTDKVRQLPRALPDRQAVVLASLVAVERRRHVPKKRHKARKVSDAAFVYVTYEVVYHEKGLVAAPPALAAVLDAAFELL